MMAKRTSRKPRRRVRRNAERRYHVVVINDRTGQKVRMTATPVTHREGVTIMSKITRYRWRRIALEPVAVANRKRRVSGRNAYSPKRTSRKRHSRKR